MKRQIKFRVWDKEIKKMRYASDDEWGFHLSSSFMGVGATRVLVICPNGDLAKYERAPNEINPDWSVVNEDFELMQFTGLKDKNGRKIYEGDIVTGNNCAGKKITAEVEYRDCVFQPLGIDAGCGDRQMTNIEIIGNIYENPELLTH